MSHHSNKFGGHRHCGIGDITILVCHVISQDHVIKGLCPFIDSSPSRLVIILRSVVAIDT